jgi:hypothetical protein
MKLDPTLPRFGSVVIIEEDYPTLHHEPTNISFTNVS